MIGCDHRLIRAVSAVCRNGNEQRMVEETDGKQRLLTWYTD